MYPTNGHKESIDRIEITVYLPSYKLLNRNFSNKWMDVKKIEALWKHDLPCIWYSFCRKFTLHMIFIPISLDLSATKGKIPNQDGSSAPAATTMRYDTIIFLKHDMEGANNMKFLLYLYEMIAGLKINFNKSEVITINDEENLGQTYAELFNCQVGLFPIKYLGVPVSPSRLHVRDWLPLVDKSLKRLDVWKGSCMSIAGRSTLISSSLNNSPIYHMSVYLLPKTIVNKMDKIRRSFFWQGGGRKENIIC